MQEGAQSPGADETVAGLRAKDVIISSSRALVAAPGVQVRSQTTAEYLELVVTARQGRLRAVTTRDYDKPTARGIRHGSPMKAVQEAYGVPSRLYQTVAGRWLVYDRAGIVFRFGQDGTVEGWTLFAWQEA